MDRPQRALNLAYYIVLFDEATDAFWTGVGLGDAYRDARGNGTFAVETHTLYKAELLDGDVTRRIRSCSAPTASGFTSRTRCST